MEVALELHQSPLQGLARDNFLEVFEGLEAAFSTAGFVAIVPAGSTFIAQASVAVCDLDPVACQRPEVRAQLESLHPLTLPEGYSEDDFGPPVAAWNPTYQAVRFTSDGRRKFVLFLPPVDTYRNERSQLALRAFVREALEHQLAPSVDVPAWWRDGQERYLTMRLMTYFRLGTFRLGGYLAGVSQLLDVRILEGEALDVREGKWPDISIAALHRLVTEYGARAAFLEVNGQYQLGVEWEDAFTNRFGQRPEVFAQSLEEALRQSTNLERFKEAHDIFDSLLEPWETGLLSASALFALESIDLVGRVPLQGIPGCPASLLMESYELGDFNGDGVEDLVFTMDESTFGSLSEDPACFAPTTVIAVYGNAEGGTPEVAVVEKDARGARDTVVADVNGDGFDDLLVVGARHAANYNPSTMPRISDSLFFTGSPQGLVPATALLENRTRFSPFGLGSEFATAGDLDGDGVQEFLFFGANVTVNFPLPFVIDCDATCSLRHPEGYVEEAYPNSGGVSIYNGAIVDLDQDGAVDLLVNMQVDPEHYTGPEVYERTYLHAAFFGSADGFRLEAYPQEVDLGFRLDGNTEPLLVDDDRQLPLNAAHYWETELIDLDGDGRKALVTLENNQFHVRNATFLLSIYAFDPTQNGFRLRGEQPPNTAAVHDQNFIFRDFDGDGDRDIISTFTGDAGPYGFSLHEKAESGWILSQGGFQSFTLNNGCNRMYMADLDRDADLDLIFFCNGGQSERLVYFGRNLKADRFSEGDRDQDGVLDALDAFPLDALEQADFDGDGLGDRADLDDDNDGLSDALEASLGSNPRLVDSDEDGVLDGEEHRIGSDLLSVDSDGDTVLDAEELELGLDPTVQDCPAWRCGSGIPLWLLEAIERGRAGDQG